MVILYNHSGGHTASTWKGSIVSKTGKYLGGHFVKMPHFKNNISKSQKVGDLPKDTKFKHE